MSRRTRLRLLLAINLVNTLTVLVSVYWVVVTR